MIEAKLMDRYEYKELVHPQIPEGDGWESVGSNQSGNIVVVTWRRLRT